jgi:FG-GAP repeat
MVVVWIGCGDRTLSEVAGETSDGGADVGLAQLEPARGAGSGSTGAKSEMSPALRAAYIAAVQSEALPEYGFELHGPDRAVARCPTQGIRAQLGSAGLVLDPSDRAGSWSLGLEATAIGRGEALEALSKPSKLELAGNRASVKRGEDIEEWYLTGRLGVEQGFVINKPPAGSKRADGDLVLEMVVTGLEPELSADGKWVSLKTEDGRSALRYSDLFVRDAAGQKLDARVGVAGQVIRLIVDDGPAVYPVQIDPLVWVEMEKLLPPGNAYQFYFGLSVSVDGDTALVGARGETGTETLAGAAYVFVRSGDTWTEQQKLFPNDGEDGDGFGISVSLSGETALVGARWDDDMGSGSGSAYVFARTGSTWTEQQKLTPSDGAPSAGFGFSVALHADTALIGAYGEDMGAGPGSAYVFVRAGTTWVEQQKLTASDGASGDGIGWSVSLRGDTALVGAKGDDDAGAEAGSAYVFVRTGTTWTQQQKLVASDAAQGDNFGNSVSVYGDAAVIGAYRDDDIADSSGAAYVFVRSGNTWNEQQKLTASDGAQAAYFGSSVALYSGSILVGAPNDNEIASQSGAVYVFSQSGSSWTQQQKLTAADGAFGDSFGRSVALSGEIALVSALSDEKGNNSGSVYAFASAGGSWTEQDKFLPSGVSAIGDDFGRSVSLFGDTALVGAKRDTWQVGSAYVFVRSGSVWSMQQELMASDGQANDNFGWSVSLYGDTALVGAWADNDMGNASGSAYVFVRDGNTWTEQQKLTASDGATTDFFGFSLSVYGDTALVGAVRDDGYVGSAYVFVRTDTTWSEQQKLTASDGATGDEFGQSVSLHGDVALVAAHGDDDMGSNSGAAYVFVRSGNAWSEQQKFAASDGTSGDNFGSSVSVFNNTALIGANGDDDMGPGSGSAYVFVRSGNAWSEQQKLTASDGASGDGFGTSVSAYGDVALVGAYSDDDMGSDSGSAYLFVRSGSNWTEQPKLNATDGKTGERFGSSASLYDNVALVGAPYDDDMGSSSGSVYVFQYGNATGDACTAWDECGSANCADNVCCDDECSGLCMGCTEAKTGMPDGQCAPIPPGGNPDGECSAGTCNGNGSCDPCGASIECASNHCADSVCCDTDCDATCVACTQAKTGMPDGQCALVPLATDPDNECGVGAEQSCDGAGTCRKELGQACIDATECFSNQCVDGVCCDTACGDLCMACAGTKTGGSDGTCAFVSADSDPDEECGTGSDQSCDGAGQCKKHQGQGCSSGSECLSSYCTDGVCCDRECGALCASCLQETTGVPDGQCQAVPLGQDPDGECGGELGCFAEGTCQLELGLSCSQQDECRSGYCVDGVCCESQCGFSCMACSAAKTKQADGQCQPISAGTDPDEECPQDPGYPASCGADGTCEGGQCRPHAPSSVECQPGSCADGTAQPAGKCDGLGHCDPPSEVRCAPYICGESACLAACKSDQDCTAGVRCDVTSGTCLGGAFCDEDHTVTAANGEQRDCTPYRCSVEGVCLELCKSGADCVAGNRCDATGRCVPDGLQSAGDEGCSCAVVGRRSGSRKEERGPVVLGLFMLALGIATSRQKRRGGRL